MMDEYKPTLNFCLVTLSASRGLPGFSATAAKRRRAPPAQLVHIVEQRRVGAKRREILEEQRALAVLAEDARRETARCGRVAR